MSRPKRKNPQIGNLYAPKQRAGPPKQRVGHLYAPAKQPTSTGPHTACTPRKLVPKGRIRGRIRHARIIFTLAGGTGDENMILKKTYIETMTGLTTSPMEKL